MFYNEEQFLSKKYFFLSLEEGHFKEKITWEAPN